MQNPRRNQTVEELKRIVLNQQTELENLHEELQAERHDLLEITAHRDRLQQRLEKSRDSVQRVEALIQKGIKQGVEREQENIRALQEENRMLTQENKFMKEEKIKYTEREGGLQQQLLALERRLQKARGDGLIQQDLMDIDRVERREKEHAQELEKRAKDLNGMARKLEEVELENRFLREMAGVPQNFGQKDQQLREFADAETKKVNEYKRLFRYYEHEIEQLERERANLKAQLRQMAILSQEDNARGGYAYPGLNQDQRAKVDEFVIKLRMGDDVERSLRSEYEVKRENQRLRDQIQMLKEELLSHLDGHVRTVNRQKGLFALSANDEELQKQMIALQEESNQKLNDIFQRLALIQQGVPQQFEGPLPTPDASGTIQLPLRPQGGSFVQIPGDRFVRPVEPVTRPGGQLEVVYTHRFQGEIPIRPFDMERDSESAKYDFAFLQTQLLEVMELSSRRDQHDRNLDEQLERIHTKLRMHVLTQDELYKSYICWKEDVSAEGRRLKEDNQQLRLNLNEARLKGEVLDKKIEQALRDHHGTDKSKIIELTKQNAILEFNLQKISQKYTQLEEQERMLRTAYHQVEPEYAERVSELTERVVKLQNWKREALYNLRFMFHKLRESVGVKKYENLVHEFSILKEKMEHFMVKQMNLQKKVADLEGAKRENYKHQQKLRELEDLRMDAEAEVESLKKRLEVIDPQFHWQMSIMNRLLMVMRRFKLSPQQIFQHFDSSGDGKLSKSEFQQALKQMRINDLTPQEFEGLISQLDVDRDGSIRYREFVNRLTRYGVRSRSNEEQIIFVMKQMVQRKGISLKSAFQIFDRDGSGIISKEEFKDALKNMQMELSDKELERVVGHLIGRVQGAGAFRALRGSSGGIEYEEFVRLFQRRVKEMEEEDSERNARGVPKSQIQLLRQEVFTLMQRTLDRAGQSPEMALQRLNLGMDGRITKEELRNFLDSIGVHISNNEYDAFFRGLDYDGDGILSTHEFIAEYQNMRRQMDIQASIAAAGQAQFGSGEQNETMRLRTQVAVLEARERSSENRYELLLNRLKDLEKHNERLESRIESMEKQNLDLNENYHMEKEQVQMLQQQMENSILASQANGLRLEQERMTIEIEKFRGAWRTYKCLYEASTNQVKMLVLASERKKDESDSLYSALRELQIKSPDHRQFGKLYYIIMLQRWQEAAANRKYDDVLNDVKNYRVEVHQLEEKLQIEESSYINSEKLLQSKMEECLQLQKELSQARNRFLTLEKSEEFITIIRELSEGKEELELQHTQARQRVLDLQGKLDEAEMRKERAEDLVDVLRNGTATELSNKVLEVSEQLGRMRLNELRAQRELDMAQEKESYLSRVNGKQLEQMKKLEMQNSQMMSKVTRVEEEMRQRDNERQALFFEAALTTEQIKTPGFSPQVPAIYSEKFNTLGRTAEEVSELRARAHQAAASRREPSSREQQEITREMSLRIKELSEQLNIAQAQIRSKERQLDRRQQWKDTDAHLFPHQEKFRDLVREQYAHLEVTHQTEERNMSEAAQKIISTLREIIANKDQMLRKKEQMVSKMRDDLKRQKEIDSTEIARLNQLLSNTGQSALNQLKDVVERNKRLGAGQTESAFIPEQTKILLQQQEATIQERDRRLDEANYQLKELRDRLARMAQSVDYMSADLEHEKRKNDVTLVKRELARAKRTITEKEKQIESLGKVIGELKGQILDHTKKLSVKEEDLNAKILSEAAAQNQAKESKNAVAKLDLLRNKANNLEKKLKTSEAKVQQLETDLGTLNKETEGLRMKLADSEAKRKEAAAPGKEAGKGSAAAQTETKLKLLEGKVAVSEKELKDARMNLLMKEQEVEKLKKDLSSKSRTFEKELAATKKKAAESRVAPVRDTGFLDKQKAENQKLQAQQKEEERRYKKMIDALNSQLQEKQKQVMKGEETIQHWKEYCAKLENVKRSYENKLAEKGRTVRPQEMEGKLFVSPKKQQTARYLADENDDFNYGDF